MSFQQGVTGLNSAARNLDVIGNNVANASTVGAKSSRAEFADIYARASGLGIGNGVTVSTVSQQFAQGSISSTGNALDVAINGNGFFQLQDSNNLVQFSRNGQFQVNREGNIVNAQGLSLLGHPISATTGLDPGESIPLQVPTAGIEPAPSTRVLIEANLPSKGALVDNAVTPIDFKDTRSYNHTTSLTLYDPKGQEVVMTYFFQKVANDTWNVYGAANGEVLNPDGGGMPQPIEQVTFAADGSAPVVPSVPLVLTVPATGLGTSLVTEPLVDLEIDLTQLTQFGAPFGPTNLEQNGSPAGRLTAVAVMDDGTVMASYSSGQSSPIGQIELANFRNPQGLQPLGGNAWASTYASGDAIKGRPGSGNLGSLQASSLEESNIDLTNELVNMMVAQRIYQANAQTVKTQDQVMQTLVNLR
jgi:flagellar hook protein FlgE